MNFQIVLIIILAALIVFLLVRRFYTPKYIKNLTQEEFIKGYRKAQLVDVREPREYDGGHILGARNIPMSQIRQRINEFRTDQPIYIYCQSGARSRQAASIIRKKRGNTEIYQLKDGFRKWTGKIKKK
ncbi:rhodanese-like domain-containing protein [Alkalicoccobacillus gibsonii]|uniref:rhodanese-like domain-containing protein n=1 Tax=Alkalicoccobacillus gibsonii TaxID=79881 RepID=UPI001932E2FA|nr:rhodanese-like domain-containing protein [Alkalicoccobacillus gibsonii]MBM0067685.1 rhodanese-like domain-containing protein [Alkalicoccobacillus gibsonii]